MDLKCSEHLCDLEVLVEDPFSETVALEGYAEYFCPYEWAGYESGICPVSILAKA